MVLPFIEIIEWVAHDPNLMMWKFRDEDKEIKNGAQLTVRESQSAMLLNEGQLADVFSPGRHQLSTENIPILSRLRGWKYGFESPFKADVYFFATHQFVNLKWGTPAPILLRDAQFGQVRVRAFGTYNVRIADVARFFRQYAGTYQQLTIRELELQLRDFIAPLFGEVLAQANIPVIEVAGNLSDLNRRIQPLVEPYFKDLGVEITQFAISSVTLPEEVTAHYDKITSMNMVTDMNKYQQFNMANAVGQQGTVINDGAMQGAMMATMMQAMQQQQAQPAPAPAADDITAKLQKLKTLFDSGLIDEADYKSKKEELLKSL
jgi:membrane protease subunit (stomatin/prohibitin family)